MQRLRVIEKNKRTKSVPTSSAQTFDLCEVADPNHNMQCLITDALKSWQINYPIMHKFALLQLATGARVSELLRITSGQISPEGRIHIIALKGGNDRIVLVEPLRTWLIHERSLGRSIFQDLNRFSIHREYVRQGLAIKFGNNSKNSTTHLFRHLVGIDLNELDNGRHAIRQGLGQKTEEAADYYAVAARRKNDH